MKQEIQILVKRRELSGPEHRLTLRPAIRLSFPAMDAVA
jgi:hypothetical protein